MTWSETVSQCCISRVSIIPIPKWKYVFIFMHSNPIHSQHDVHYFRKEAIASPLIRVITWFHRRMTFDQVHVPYLPILFSCFFLRDQRLYIISYLPLRKECMPTHVLLKFNHCKFSYVFIYIFHPMFIPRDIFTWLCTLWSQIYNLVELTGNLENRNESMHSLTLLVYPKSHYHSNRLCMNI